MKSEGLPGVTWWFGDRDPGTRPASPLSPCVVQRQPAGPSPAPPPPRSACMPPLRAVAVESGTGVGPAVEFLVTDASSPSIPGTGSDERRVCAPGRRYGRDRGPLFHVKRRPGVRNALGWRRLWCHLQSPVDAQQVPIGDGFARGTGCSNRHVSAAWKWYRLIGQPYQLVTREIISSKKDAAKPASRPRRVAPPHPNALRQWKRCSRSDRRDELSHGPLVTTLRRQGTLHRFT